MFVQFTLFTVLAVKLSVYKQNQKLIDLLSDIKIITHSVRNLKQSQTHNDNAVRDFQAIKAGAMGIKKQQQLVERSENIRKVLL
jgi:hypothetical protein